MKTFKDLREGYASAAQRKAVWAARNDAKKEDTAVDEASCVIALRRKPMKYRKI